MDPRLTVILPVWNESEALPRVLDDVLAVAAQDGFSVLVMDDGSTDGSAALLNDTASRMHRLRVVHLPHGGKDAALWRAFAEAGTEWVGVMDADGQYDPADFVRVLGHADATGADAVWGIRSVREDNGVRKLSSWMGRMMKRLLLGPMVVRDPGCGLVIMRRKFCMPVIEACPRPFGQLHCHLADLIRAQGGVVAELPIAHRPRQAGSAKFGAMNRIVPGLASLVQARRVREKLHS